MDNLMLPDRLDRTAVAALALQWRNDWTAGQPVRIDASAVSRIGQIGWQLLISAVATARAGGNAISIVSPSPAMVAAAAYCGLGPWLEELA